MSIRLKRKSNTMTISSLNEWRTLNKFNMTPSYQRHSVWSSEQQSLLVDSILKNIPIPPIFLREHIDKQGKTTFEVIDGKQRLTSIFKFIDNEIATADDDNDALHVEELAGLYLSDLEENDDFEDALSEFWAYPLPIEYVYTKDDKTVEKIFDRLNRSGEKLTGQELRNANYYDSMLIKLAYKFAKSKYWDKQLDITNKTRMEDIELVSEFIFLLIEKQELSASPKEIDALYKKYANSKAINWVELEIELFNISSFFEKLDIDFTEYNVSGVSHLYGVWAFSYYCVTNGVDVKIKNKVHEFYQNYKNSNFNKVGALAKYKSSMMNATKGKGQRKKRRNALVEYCIK
ncbi:DUF262 domain-containing protein [Shewanella sp. NKUCC06_TVS]|uniref:GmrSD restriction endonuclease domain-containing protein n=1 Tax=Shewanella sp. NKUCC06_TVS TaxID=2842128 RepID=UPI001C5BB397|nr:DUF262 domain-containing protein [Shewanella sp. NKUCC06_TVS]MBW3530528.1 DUF262 domain-containing protein [Shewanella sp. NKUCC06_TVS]